MNTNDEDKIIDKNFYTNQKNALERKLSKYNSKYVSKIFARNRLQRNNIFAMRLVLNTLELIVYE